jgi:hypothetical protein
MSADALPLSVARLSVRWPSLACDPSSFVTISLPPTRFTTPVVKKTLSPLFPAKESTFDFPIYASRAAGLELVVYDKVGGLALAS